VEPARGYLRLNANKIVVDGRSLNDIAHGKPPLMAPGTEMTEAVTAQSGTWRTPFGLVLHPHTDRRLDINHLQTVLIFC
jgi:hypothetical protein